MNNKLIGYVINLEHSTDRLRRFYQTPNAKETFIRFNAIFGEKLSYEEIDKVFDRKRGNAYEHREMGKNEIACTLSHLGVYKEIVNNQDIKEEDFVLVAEDDIALIEDWLEVVNHIIQQVQNVETIKVVSFQISNVNNITYDFNRHYNAVLKTFTDCIYRLPINKNVSLVPTYYLGFVRGAACYLMRKSQARKIIEKAAKEKAFWHADHWELLLHPFEMLYTLPNLAYARVEIESMLDKERKFFQKRDTASIHDFTPEEIEIKNYCYNNLYQHSKNLFAQQLGLEPANLFIYDNIDCVRSYDLKGYKYTSISKLLSNKVLPNYHFKDDVKINIYVSKPTAKDMAKDENVENVRRCINIFIDVNCSANELDDINYFDLIVNYEYRDEELRDDIKNHPNFISILPLALLLADITKQDHEIYQTFRELATMTSLERRKRILNEGNKIHYLEKKEDKTISLYLFENHNKLRNMLNDNLKEEKYTLKLNDFQQPFSLDYFTYAYLNNTDDMSLMSYIAEHDLMLAIENDGGEHKISSTAIAAIKAGVIPIIPSNIPALTHIFNRNAILYLKTIENLEDALKYLANKPEVLYQVQNRPVLTPEAPEILMEMVKKFKAKLRYLTTL